MSENKTGANISLHTVYRKGHVARLTLVFVSENECYIDKSI